MYKEMKKAAKIVEELSLYFMALGANHVESSIDRDGKEGVIRFRSDYDPDFEHKLDGLEEMLNQPHNAGMEDLYWELAGSGDPGESGQLLLVGMMIDSAQIARGDGRVELTLHKGLSE